MPARKGTKPPNAGKGRAKGVPNRLTKTVREAILAAFDELGGVAWLVRLGRTNPTEFARLLGRLLPREVQVTSSTGTKPPSLDDPRVLEAALALDDAVANANRVGPVSASDAHLGAVPLVPSTAPLPTPDEATSVPSGTFESGQVV